MDHGIIEIKGLKKRYPKAQEFALRGIDLSVKPGEFFGLLGPNGSGKTTLISILCGLLPLTEGEVTIAGHDLQHMHTLKPLIGLVPQDVALYPTLSFVENMNYFGRLYGLKGQDLKDSIDKCLKLAGLEKFPDRQIGKFSGGMKRRANLALGILHTPKILFLDEPSVNVDPQSRDAIFDILRKLNGDGTTIIYTTHYLEEAESMCHRVSIIDTGKVICTDTPSNLIKAHPDTKDLGEVFMTLTGRHLRD